MTFNEKFPSLIKKPTKNYSIFSVNEMLEQIRTDVEECCLDKQIVREAIKKLLAKFYFEGRIEINEYQGKDFDNLLIEIGLEEKQ